MFIVPLRSPRKVVAVSVPSVDVMVLNDITSIAELFGGALPDPNVSVIRSAAIEYVDLF